MPRNQQENAAMAAFDVAVIGLGVMGSATLSALARRGRRVIGIDRFGLGHDRGSSHGRTRIIRLGYFEHPSYVPLLRAAYPLWRDLEARSGKALLTVTGIVEIGPPDGELVEGTLRASKLHNLPHEVLDSRSLMARFPAFRVPEHMVGVFQPDGGFVRAEPTIEALVAEARAAGAEVRFQERVIEIAPDGNGARVRTERETFAADRVIVAAGPWVTTLMGGLQLPVKAVRQVLGWFEPADTATTALFSPDRFPVFMLESDFGLFYGFPADGSNGVKVARHSQDGAAVDPESYERAVSPTDEEIIRAALKAHLPAADGKLLAATTCLYTMSPDGDFIIDRLPAHPQVVVASPCSGHGFKFAPLIGEILADLATDGRTVHDISRFSVGRFL
jgi:sarcosine oxidase